MTVRLRRLPGENEQPNFILSLKMRRASGKAKLIAAVVSHLFWGALRGNKSIDITVPLKTPAITSELTSILSVPGVTIRGTLEMTSFTLNQSTLACRIRLENVQVKM
jgi:hypothetical protein